MSRRPKPAHRRFTISKAQLTEIPPIDTEPRGLFVDRIIPADATRDDFVAGRIAMRTKLGSPAAWTRTGASRMATVALHLRCDDLAKTVYVES